MRRLPLTDAARASMQAAQRTPGTVLGICADFPPPGLSIFPDLREISIGDSTVEIRFEAQGQDLLRVVHLDQSSHPANLVPTLLGHSIGHFEGETLVIDTVGFEPYRAGITIGVPSSPSKHLVERLTLMPDRHHLVPRHDRSPYVLRRPGRADRCTRRHSPERIPEIAEGPRRYALTRPLRGHNRSSAVATNPNEVLPGSQPIG